ncbi:MAG TPA: hypothetical protein V6D13_09825 [Halomicronema sp.]
MSYENTALELAKDSVEKEREVASNPCTAGELLAKLADSEDAKIRQLVAGNPNTPMEVLFKLGVEFPEEFLNNPILGLLLLEDPNLAVKIPLPTLRSIILKCDNVPVSFMEWGAGHFDEGIKVALAQNCKTPASVLEKLADHQNYEVRWYVAQHPNTPASVLEKLASDKTLVYNRPIVIRVAVANNPNTPAKVLEKLAETQEVYNLIEIGRNIREAVAQNPNTPEKVLEKLAEDKEVVVRRAVSLNANITENLVVRLTLDRKRGEKLNENAAISSDLLEKLAAHVEAKVRAIVALHPNTPKRILKQLAKDKSESVRQAVASNVETPKEIL